LKDEIKLLIVDDSTSNVDMLFRLFGDKYQVFVATDGHSALSLLEDIDIHIILLDLILPDIHGKELLRQIRSQNRFKDVHVIVISGVQEEEEIQKIKAMNIQGFFSKPLNLPVLETAVRNLQVSKNCENQDLTSVKKAENNVVELMQGYLHLADIVSHLKSPGPRDHPLNISWISYILAKKIKLDSCLSYYLFLASPLRDIGLLHVPQKILQKKGSLNYDEWLTIQQHTQQGLGLLELDNPIFTSASVIARQHHEHWDGNGYPAKLRGEEIKIESRIVALSDTLNSLLSHRHYRGACSFDQALDTLRQGEGTRYDPYLVKHLLECKSDLKSRYQKQTYPEEEKKILREISKLF